MILQLVRHGEAEGQPGRCVGWCDLPLGDAGREEARRLAARWGAPPARVVASDLARARETAAILAARWRDIVVEHDARLREMHFGAWDGRAWDALEAEDGERLGAWMADWATARAPDGEAFPDVLARVAAWLDGLRATPATGDARVAGDARIVVVAHAGSIRALLCALLDLPLARAFALRVDHGRVSEVRLSARGAELRCLNADGPLDAPPVPA